MTSSSNIVFLGHIMVCTVAPKPYHARPVEK